MALTADQKDEFFKYHLPHRLCLLTAFRDRQPWFKERVGQKDGDLLRVAKDSALLMIRMFADFMGLRNGRRGSPGKGKKSSNGDSDDVFVETLGLDRVALTSLPQADQQVIEELTTRGNKELAHLTSTFADQNALNTAEIVIKGINIIERLLREKVYDRAKDRTGHAYTFPTLENEKTIDGSEYEILGGRPCGKPAWQ
jgi:hypothetical protein